MSYTFIFLSQAVLWICELFYYENILKQCNYHTFQVLLTSTEGKIQRGHLLFKTTPAAGPVEEICVGCTCQGYPEVSLHTSERALFQLCTAANSNSFFSEIKISFHLALPGLIGTEH